MGKEKEEQKDTMKTFLQKQPYNLTIAKHNLGIHQLRIMARVVQAIQPYMSLNIDLRNPKPDIWVEVDVKNLVVGGNVKPLKKALEGLMKKIVYILHFIPEEATFLEIGMPLIKEFDYKHGSEVVKIQLGSRLLPQLIDLARGYTKYSLDVAFKTSSPNIFKLYQYFSHFRDKKQIQCNVETLRQWLKLEDKYAKPGDIKKWILTPAIEELKEKADVWFTIADRVTKGRKMVGWKFNIHTKKELKNNLKISPKIDRIKEEKKIEKPNPENSLKLNEIEQLKAKLKAMEEAKKEEDYKNGLVRDFGLGLEQVKKLMEFNKINGGGKVAKELRAIKELIDKGFIKNIGGYTVKVLQEKLGVKL